MKIEYRPATAGLAASKRNSTFVAETVNPKPYGVPFAVSTFATGLIIRRQPSINAVFLDSSIQSFVHYGSVKV
jgi:hypothetical protein